MPYLRHEHPPPKPRPLSEGDGSAPIKSRPLFQTKEVRASHCRKTRRLWSKRARMESRMEEERPARPQRRPLWTNLEAHLEEGVVDTKEYFKRSRRTRILGRLLDAQTTHHRHQAVDGYCIRRSKCVACAQTTGILLSEADQACQGTERGGHQDVALHNLARG